MLAIRGSAAGTWAISADAPVARVREEVGDHLEPLGVDARWHDARGVDEVVDRGHVEALRELLLVAEERGDVAPVLARDVDDRLAVRIDEHRAREALERPRPRPRRPATTGASAS